MGIFSFGKKDEAAPRRRGAEAGSGRRSSQNTRVERRSRRPDRSGDAEAMLLDPTLPEKQRARRRLVGAIALVVAAIVILPMVLDSHPKPVTDDIAIDIPSRPATADDKNAARDDADDTQAGVAPDNPGASGLAATAAAASAPTTQTAQNANTAATPSKSAAPAQSQATASSKTSQNTQTAQASTAPKTAARPAAPSATTPAASNQETDSGNGNAGNGGSPATPPGARFAVQLGSFANDSAARNWVTKLKAAGVPAYTEQRKQPDGSTRTLLRAGPFPDRAAASEAIAKVRGAGLMSGSNGAAE
ncbi:SPOR domain-containing protein [Paraburkholderia ferrariae]|jgi:DedD protein|uniref:SPOR domain-containing protein n=1 Tax=Paraburkholderia ferrariae TaxID=386056 RepID=UPI000484F898|nr:SPOR domain-containing protein [Paraburkholderia ferrariae]